MPAVDRNLLRIRLYEPLWADDVPDAVAISEAVLLARDLSTEASPGFVNGLLARLPGLKAALQLWRGQASAERVSLLGPQAGAKRSLRPSLRRTERNHRVDAPVPAMTRAAVAAVESMRNVLVGSVTIITARPAVSSRKIPAHSQVSPWKKRCRPGGVGGRLPQRHPLGGKPGQERIRPARRLGEQDAHAEVREREMQQEEPEL